MTMTSISREERNLQRAAIRLRGICSEHFDPPELHEVDWREITRAAIAALSPDERLIEALKQAALDLHEAAGRFACIGKLNAQACSELTREAARRAELAVDRPGGGEELLPCPFCGGDAQRFTIGEDEPNNAGGDVISCTRCGASSHVEFGRKENLVSRWNTRALTKATDTESGR